MQHGLPIANFYKTPKLAAGLACLAISPFILGFTHLDFRRLQRTQNFRPEAVRSLASELVSLVVTAVAAWLTHSFVAILFGLISRSAVLVLTSHLGAERRYKQLISKGIPATLDSLRADLEARDARDSSRSVAPLKPAVDAKLLDNSDLTVQASVEQVLDWWQGKQPFRSA